jgi:hypothetical protein
MAKPPEPSQIEKFRELARQLECDDDEDAFKAKLVKLAKAPRTPKPERPG